MTNQLFSSYDGWDQSDTASFIFYQVVLKIQIGDNLPGTKFESACIAYDKARLELYEDDGSEPKEVYKLNLVIGDRINA